MKKVMILLIAAMFVAFTGCEKKEEQLQNQEPQDENGTNDNNDEVPVDTTDLRNGKARVKNDEFEEFEYLPYTEENEARFYRISDSIVIGEDRAVVMSVTPSGGAGWYVGDDDPYFLLKDGATLTFKARAEADPMYFTDLFLNAYTCSWYDFELTNVESMEWQEEGQRDGHLTTKRVREFSLKRRDGTGDIRIFEINVQFKISKDYQRPNDAPHPGSLISAEFDFTVGEGTFPAGPQYPAGTDAVELEITNNGGTAAQYVQNGRQAYLDFPKGNVLKLRPRGGVELRKAKFDIDFGNTEPNPNDLEITNADPGDEPGVLELMDKTAETSVKISDEASMESLRIKKITVYYKDMPR